LIITESGILLEVVEPRSKVEFCVVGIPFAVSPLVGMVKVQGLTVNTVPAGKLGTVESVTVKMHEPKVTVP
jgi:hypothetical protein